MIIALTSMVIRAEQIGHLSKRMSEDFVTRLVCYVKKNFPVKFTALGEESVRALARYGIDAAGQYGIVGRDDICLYVGVMFAFHPRFDSDPELPWAGQNLRGPGDPSARMRCVFEMARQYADMAPPGTTLGRG
jgi:hypothetical protein